MHELSNGQVFSCKRRKSIIYQTINSKNYRNFLEGILRYRDIVKTLCVVNVVVALS